MTRAVVFCPDPARSAVLGGGTASSGAVDGRAVDGGTVLERLSRQLGECGVDSVHLVVRPGAASTPPTAGVTVHTSTGVLDDLAVVRSLARDAGTDLVVCEGDLVAHDTAVFPALRATVTTALLGPRDSLDPYPPALAQRGRVVSVGSTYHTVSAPNSSLRGLLRVAAGDVAALDTACASLAEFAAGTGAPDVLAGAGGTVALVVLALVRSGTPVAAHRVRILCCRRAGSAEQAHAATAELSGVDERAVALKLAVKEHDDLFATYGVSTYSPRLVRRIAGWGLSPTQVTWISIGFAVLAAGSFAVGGRIALVAGAVLLYVGFVFDCLDGQLARYTRRYSRFGGWLDAIADRSKEYLVYAGIAVGAARAGHGLWPAAVAALALQTVRHMTDVWYGVLQNAAVAKLPGRPLREPHDALAPAPRGDGPQSRMGSKLSRVSARLESNHASPGYWFKRTIVFPIGERWLLIAVAAAVGGPRVAVAALLIWSVLALGYTLAGRTLRSWGQRTPSLPGHDIPLFRDDGPVARFLGRLGRGWLPPLPTTLVGLGVAGVLVILGTAGRPAPVDLTGNWTVLLAGGVALLAGLAAGHPHAGRLDWLVPAALRAMEYLVVVVVGRNDGLPVPEVFALLFIVALYQYDLAARLDKGSSPVLARWLDLGWDGRVLLLSLAGLLGVGGVVAGVLAGYLVLTFFGSALVGLARRTPPAAPAAPVAAIPDQVARPAGGQVPGQAPAGVSAAERPETTVRR